MRYSGNARPDQIFVGGAKNGMNEYAPPIQKMLFEPHSPFRPIISPMVARRNTTTVFSAKPRLFQNIHSIDRRLSSMY